MGSWEGIEIEDFKETITVLRGRISCLRSYLEIIAKLPHAGARHLANEALKKDHEDVGE